MSDSGEGATEGHRWRGAGHAIGFQRKNQKYEKIRNILDFCGFRLGQFQQDMSMDFKGKSKSMKNIFTFCVLGRTCHWISCEQARKHLSCVSIETQKREEEMPFDMISSTERT